MDSTASLGPQVVGKRVVVRSIVNGESGPTGGPAFTDVLGICEQWDDIVVVRRADGTAATIERSLIVSGKTVPDPPQRRR